MSDNIPPSQMLRVPSALVDAVKELSRLHRSGYTAAVLTGLQQLIASIDSTVDSISSVTAGKSDTELLAELIAGLDERIAAQVAVQVRQLEQRLSAQLVEENVGDSKSQVVAKLVEENVGDLLRLAAADQCQQELLCVLDDQVRADVAVRSEVAHLEVAQLELEQSELTHLELEQPRPAPPVVVESQSPARIEVDVDAQAVNPVEDMALGNIGEVENADAGNMLVEEREGQLGQEHRLQALTSPQLEKRLGVSNGTISRNKNWGNEHFRKWSAEHDRDGVAWEYREGASPRFHPLV